MNDEYNMKDKFYLSYCIVIHGGFHLFRPLQRLLHVHFIHIRCDPCAISSPCPLFKLEMHELKTLAELIHYYNSESLFLQGTIFGVPFRLLRQSSLCSFPSLIERDLENGEWVVRGRWWGDHGATQKKQSRVTPISSVKVYN